MTQRKTLPGDAVRAMMEFDRCRDDPIVWRSMVLAVLLEREELLSRHVVARKWVLLWVLNAWVAWSTVLYMAVHP